MRQAFAHQAELELSAGHDGAPGAAVTMALCGHWNHHGACRWPHHTAVQRGDGRRLSLRTVFACEPADEQAVRARLVTALRTGRLVGPSGLAVWNLVSEEPTTLRTGEHQLGARLAATGLLG